MMPNNLHNGFSDSRLLLIDKPLDWTSFDVVRRVRSVFQLRKVGHAGTLDPRATGLLIVATGAMTKSLQQYADDEKEYEGTFQIGIRTPSFDLETPVAEQKDWTHIHAPHISELAQKFIGTQQQLPPMFSAVKIGGRPLYRFARKGRTIERAERTIEVKTFELTKIVLPEVHFHIVCTKGTYIRAIIDDFGQKLGCGATLISLRRTRIGSFVVEDALSIDELERYRQMTADVV
ncbi:MAG: tRNA pseudouridine(55) synthase TruB [Ignavibacteriales bacterium]|nr:tRNA pseudouridine(55) synthase TruB [Ignavibacteriales bacterium]